MKYYIIAGEPSGDLHGSNLMKAIKEQDISAEFSFWGGDHMLEVDKGIVTHIRETSIMGFVEVLRNISKIKSFFKKAKSTILEFQPDVVVLIDYPGFNLRMAKWAKKKGFKVVYYISPQLWAWKKGRIKTIKKYVDEMIVILPFELDFYKENGVKVHFVGHPLLPVIQSFKGKKEERLNIEDDHDIIAILPGSREQEIKKMLPEMVKAAGHFIDDFEICIAMAPNVERAFYESLVETLKDKITWVENDTYSLLSKANIALVTSGTATLETALFGVPQVVCYKTSRINYEIGKRLVDLEFISLVNLIAGKEIVPELIQDEVNAENIIDKIKRTLINTSDINSGYNKLHNLLYIDKDPSTYAANIIVKSALI